MCLTLIHSDSYSADVAHRTPPQNGFAIRDFRIKAGLTIDELAARANISAPHQRNIENELRPASAVHLHRLAEILGVRAASLVRDNAALSGERVA